MISVDVSIFDDWWYREESPQAYSDVLKLLYWRGRIQNAVKDMFFALVARELITADGVMSMYNVGA